MNACRVRFYLLSCAVSVFSLACVAQAPIERRDPEPIALGNHQWPTGKTLHRNTLLLVYSFDPYRPPSECRVREIAVDRLICYGGFHERAVEFPREAIAMLQKEHRPFAQLLFLGGLTSLGLSLLCGVDGGPLCFTPAVVGLSLVTAALVVFIVENVRHARGHGALPLYEAPAPLPHLQSGPSGESAPF